MKDKLINAVLNNKNKLSYDNLNENNGIFYAKLTRNFTSIISSLPSVITYSSKLYI